MRVLVTGISGFAGRHLADRLNADGDQVHGLVRRADVTVEGAALHVADLLDEPAVHRLVAGLAPDVIYHLAAASSAAESLRDPLESLRVNLLGTAVVLRAALLAPNRPRVLLVTSSEIYGAPADLPLTEVSPPAPRHAYGVSKLAAHELAQQMYRTDGLDVVEARPFNHLGPGQRLGFVAPDFAAQLAAIELGRQVPVLRVGDLTPRRDFSDVRDIVRGYAALAREGAAGQVYHLCSGRGIAIREIVDQLVALSGLDVRVETDDDRRRPGADAVVVGSYDRAREAVGWSPSIPLETSLAEVLAEWRARAAG